MRVLRKKKKSRMRKKKKKKRKLRLNHLKLIRMKIQKMLNQKLLQREAWRKRILDRCWPEVLRLETMGAVVTTVLEELAKTNLIQDHGN